MKVKITVTVDEDYLADKINDELPDGLTVEGLEVLEE